MLETDPSRLADLERELAEAKKERDEARANLESAVDTFARAIGHFREAMDERNDFKNRARAAESLAVTARRDALEEAAKVADREQDECAEHEDNAFTDSVAARWSAAADAAHRIAAGIRTLASTVPGVPRPR